MISFVPFMLVARGAAIRTPFASGVVLVTCMSFCENISTPRLCLHTGAPRYHLQEGYGLSPSRAAIYRFGFFPAFTNSGSNQHFKGTAWVANAAFFS
jgi:hypothetical protein